MTRELEKRGGGEGRLFMGPFLYYAKLTLSRLPLDCIASKRDNCNNRYKMATFTNIKFRIATGGMVWDIAGWIILAEKMPLIYADL